MAAYRFFTVLLSASAAGLLAMNHAACAEGAPGWQPYRELPGQGVPVPHLEVAAQADFATFDQPSYVVTEPAERLPIEALTDAELEELSSCCGEPYLAGDSQFDPILGSEWARGQPAPSGSHAGLALLPGDLIWHSYWAGAKEPRTSGTLFQESSDNISLLDVTLGGRASVMRNAIRRDSGLWRGWELQIEGGAILRLNVDQHWDFDATDFRFGVPFILARDQLQWKFAYYHLSSHVGDEFLVRNPGFRRINYSRDVLVLGASYFPITAWRWYAEAGWAFYDDEGADAWELQFGFDFAQPGPTGKRGTPFVALNGHLREEVQFGGNLALQAGWLWRGRTGRLLRTGLHYYNGKSSQFEFFDQSEQQIGFGLWQEY